ncbi:MAG TPA: RdgB/HAM1 family non-canonical purine NTP pyrophosphatase, partial [Ktedonobacterales bacterium]|nr:RdgB/HAM1 family non-canonical purine NTP pyrophosphatase [Ktedonobacterales bacterium]
MTVPPDTTPAPARPRLLIATTNPHKLAEFATLLRPAPFALVDPRAIGLDQDLDVAETGTTFAANAAIKALAWARVAGMLALADDSGLEIDALNGEPGVYSARWAGPEATYPERFRILLGRLSSVPHERRTARYRCALAVADPAGLRLEADGTVEGYIATEPRGAHGFGYDPIFEVPERGLTFGELGEEYKHAVSHRGRAV